MLQIVKLISISMELKKLKIRITALFVFVFAVFSPMLRAQKSLCDIKFSAKNSTIIINCGGNQQVIKGDANIKNFLRELSEKTTKIMDEIETGQGDIKNLLEQLKENLYISIWISTQIRDYQQQANKLTIGAIERLIHQGRFFDAYSILSENNSTAEFEVLKKISKRLNYYLLESEKDFDQGAFLLSLRFVDSIRIIGQNRIDLAFLREKSDKIKEKTFETVQNDIINEFDRINCMSCPIPNENSPSYYNVFEKFRVVYNLPQNGGNLNEWIEKDLKWFISSYYSKPESFKQLHSEALYRICFMFYYDFAKINKRKYKNSDFIFV